MQIYRELEIRRFFFVGEFGCSDDMMVFLAVIVDEAIREDVGCDLMDSLNKGVTCGEVTKTHGFLSNVHRDMPLVIRK